MHLKINGKAVYFLINFNKSSLNNRVQRKVQDYSTTIDGSNLTKNMLIFVNVTLIPYGILNVQLGLIHMVLLLKGRKKHKHICLDNCFIVCLKVRLKCV